jgi:TfoX/Sxy family transcriptional regulator of competence genes
LNIPHPSEESKKFFDTTVPAETNVTVKTMFGNISAFINGNMFMGLYGDDLFVRLPHKDGHELGNKGAAIFEPMKGRPMKGYFFVPKQWWSKPEIVQKWVTQSLDYARKLPPKKARNKTIKESSFR